MLYILPQTWMMWFEAQNNLRERFNRKKKKNYKKTNWVGGCWPKIWFKSAIQHPLQCIGWVALSSLVVCPASTKVILLSQRLLSEWFQRTKVSLPSHNLFCNYWYGQFEVLTTSKAQLHQNYPFLRYCKKQCFCREHFQIHILWGFLLHCQATMIVNCVNRAKLTKRLLHGLYNLPPTPLKYFWDFYICSQLSIICTTALNCVGM